MKQPLGVLILHGFTGSLDTVRAVVPQCESLRLPYRMPVLRGHGTRFEDLDGVTAEDWIDDAKAALDDLLTEVDRVVIVGLSMGGLVAMQVAMRHGANLAGLVLLAPAMRFADPLTHLTPLLKVLFKYWDSPGSFVDKECAKACTNYKKFPTATFARLLDLGNMTERELGKVRVPVTTLMSRKDTVVHAIVPKLLDEKLGGTHQTIWFEKSGHEMLQDLEASAVAEAVGRAVQAHIPQPAGQAG